MKSAVYTRSQHGNNIVIQAKRPGEKSRSFTLHTDMTLNEVVEKIIDVFSKQ